MRTFLKKYLFPGSLAAMSTVPSVQWIRSRFGTDNPSVAQQHIAEAYLKTKEIENQAISLLDELIENQNFKTSVTAQALSVKDTNQLVENKLSELKKISDQLMESGLTPNEQANLMNSLKDSARELIILSKNNVNLVQELVSKATEASKAKNSDATSSSNIVSDGFNVTTSKVEENINQVLDSTNVKESGFLDYFLEFKEIVSNELASLSAEQLGCFTNIMGFIMIFGGMVTITSILFGQYLIDYFNLEKRYPKLAKFLKLKAIADKYYLISNIIIIYLIIIFFIVLNLYMFITA